MKTNLAILLATLCFSAALHAEEPVPVPAPRVASHAESAESKPHAESAEAAEPGSPAGRAAERSEAEGVPRSEPAENAGPAASRAVKPLRAEVSLTDGSLLKGSLRRRFLPAESATFGRFRLDLKAVKSIEFSHAESAAPKSHAEGAETAEPKPHAESAAPDLDLGFVDNDSGRARSPAPFGRISFRNGDTVTATLLPKRDRLVLDTVAGPIAVPLRAVASLVIASNATDALLYHCTFDSPVSITSPAAGPAGRFLGGEFVPGKKGRALLVKARTPAAEVPFPTGLMQPEGCIEFWAKIPGATKDTRYPDGGNPQFFAMGVGPWVNTFVKYTANDGFGTSGLHADLPGSAYVSSAPSVGDGCYPVFLGNPAAWHHYALVWSEKGLDAASKALGRRVVSALYVDGRLVNPSYGTNGPDRAKFLRQFSDLPVILHFPFFPGRQLPNQSQVDFLIDEFKIWSVPKFDAAGAAVVPIRQYKPELIYHCTFDSAEAIERPAAGPNGKFLGGEFVPGKKGRALRTFADEPAAEVDFEPGTLGARGTIEFWAKADDRDDSAFGLPEGNLRFFGLWHHEKGVKPRWCTTHLQYTVNDGMGMSGLCGMVNHCSWATNPSYGHWPYELISADRFGWHHYAIVWNVDGLLGTVAEDGGLSTVAIYLDGKLVPTRGRQTLSFGHHLKEIAPRCGKLAFPTPSNGWGSSAGHIPFIIDEFKIWSAPKTVF